ncbi:MAG: chromosomal replication initiator protein DnaA [Deltaproteobacteria bacterium]|nr:MAG: chromosomal replication initiator protein DnaA [Deltaproteobacteria bacterium]
MSGSLSTAVNKPVDRPATEFSVESERAALDLWTRAIDRLKGRLSRHTFQTYFEPIKPVSLIDDELTLAHSSKFMIDWVRDNLLDVLLTDLEVQHGARCEVKFVVRERPGTETDTGEPAPASRESRPPVTTPSEPPPSRQLQINPKYSFDSFVVGPSNQFAVAACTAVANAPGKAYNPLFLYGGVGLGKTHLVHAVGNHALKQNPDCHVVYLSSETFTNDLIHALEQHRMPEFRARYREKCDILLLDDIQFLSNKKQTMEEFFHTFNALHEAGKQIFVTSDKLPTEIDGFEERLRSRFQWGLIADIQPPEVETRVAILKKKAATDKIALPDDVALFLGTHIRSNVRELEGSLIRLAAFASLTGAALTVELAQDVLKNILVVRGDKPDVETIIKVVAEQMQVKPQDIKGDRRQQNVARARQVAMYLTRKITQLSYPVIGERFGGKDHSTVINAEQRIEQLMGEEPELRATVESLQRRLNS